ncbi:hypothetical protein GE09DRAFT_1137787 [Coniochaeta sp. 2T2.1]|nr:hypothetical protein GE09DRAFT_1137787 [Coniochaeta sp. 2T2.1]
MPSHLPSSFASAAAGQTRDSTRTGGRSDVATRGSGSGEWSRREGRTTNGTLTFRRSSTTPFNQSAPHPQNDTPQTPAAEQPSSNVPQTPSFDSSSSRRYSKEQLLDLYRNLPDTRHPEVSNLFAPGWNPGQVNGGTSARPWGKAGDSNHVAPDPGVCWNSEGTMLPVGLVGMTAEEKELFSTDVNSPLKIPQVNKDGTPAGNVGQNGRKTSVSQAASTGYGVTTPSTASRPGTRRRETTDTNPFPGSAVASPTASRFESSWLSRKNTATKEPVYDEPEDENAPSREQPTKTQSFASLNRSNTAGTSGFGAAPSIWGSSTAAPTPGLGAFGNFALPTQSTPDKRLGSTRGESRLAHLIPKDAADAFTAKSGEPSNQEPNKTWRARPRTDTDPFGADDALSGSAVLGGSHDASPPTMPSQPQGGSIFDTPVKGNAGDFGMAGLNLGGDGDANGPASPSETNPYRSPLADRGDAEHDSIGFDRSHHFGHAPEQPSNFASVSRAFGATTFEGSDRSQTSSVGAKGYPALSNLTGWPAGPSTGTPDRERPAFTSAFGNSLFSPAADLQSPGLGGLGGMFPGPSTGNIGSTGSLRGSKLGSLFPASMQAQMQNADQETLGDSLPDLRQSNPLGAIGRGPVGMQPRETESPLRSGRGVFEDLFPSVDPARHAFTIAEHGLPSMTSTSQGPSFTPTSIAPPFSGAQSSEPAAQNRTMVMPDRMRWVYLDPQGQTQGPFSGLEMNDWYKAQFFTPDLRVKKVEDPDFEPLGQLIRRIGNSREPFLVPQIGIPHGPPSQTGTFSPGDSRGVIPPLMGAFPSFGRTLTAEEQNNLERRKQEEQILMARQREFLAQQQAFTKIQMQPAPGSLHHHSSAHSLQSQPSFGSISSPLGMGPQAPIGALGPNPGFFDSTGNLLQPTPPSGVGIGSDLLQQDLTPQERQTLASLQAGGALGNHFLTQPIGAPPADAGLRSQLPGVDQLQNDSQGFNARLKEFQDIRAQRDAEATSKSGLPEVREESTEFERIMKPTPTATEQAIEIMQEHTRTAQLQDSKRAAVAQAQQQLSLTQQVQKTQAAAAAAAAASKQPEAEDAWAKSSASGLPMPFPPPSSTPLPAPTAQRQRSTLPTQFTTPSPSATPDTLAEATAPPPLAPWAPQPGIESHKGPSLKEIQEAEAKKAAKAEEAAAAARRALLEHEAAALREREKASASAASGLPSTSTWGTGSPVNTPSASSPWAKPAVMKGAVAGPASTAASTSANERKKTLAEIQREEEARKQKARELALQQGVTPAAALGKRYADLASKTSVPPGLIGAPTSGPVPPTGSVQVAGNGWATVGAGGKVKTPAVPATQARVASATAVKSAASPAAKPVSKPSAPTTSRDSGSDAMQEFHKWVHRELSRGLSGVPDIDAFASNLMGFPLDPSILADAVYANSTTMDGRHFGEEFVRRKKLADRGIVEKQPTPAPGTDAKNNPSGGWSEVAKKGGSAAINKDETSIPGSPFKVVPGRKKGKK